MVADESGLMPCEGVITWLLLRQSREDFVLHCLLTHCDKNWIKETCTTKIFFNVSDIVI